MAGTTLSFTQDGVVVGTAGKRDNPVDYGADPESVRDREKRLISRVTGILPSRTAFLSQVHGDAVLEIADWGQCAGRDAGEADAVFTALPGACLVIRSADCVPVFVYEPLRRVLGAAHSGWRGARLAIAAKLVSAMKEAHGCDPSAMKAWILPSIGPESYAVGEEVARQFPRNSVGRGGSFYVDLWGSARDALVSAGVPGEAITVSGICTLLGRDEYFSHRAGDAGRNLNYGWMTPS